MNSFLILAKAAEIWVFVFGGAMFAIAVFLMLLVLVQRGRGGGLAGAFGGMGGQSAFGAKAGDTFTKVTIWTSTVWILVCMAALAVLNPRPVASDAPPAGINPPGATAPADGAAADGAEDITDAESADATDADADGSEAEENENADG